MRGTLPPPHWDAGPAADDVGTAERLKASVLHPTAVPFSRSCFFSARRSSVSLGQFVSGVMLGGIIVNEEGSIKLVCCQVRELPSRAVMIEAAPIRTGR